MVTPSIVEYIVQIHAAIEVDRYSVRDMAEQGLGLSQVQTLDLGAVKVGLFVLEGASKTGQVPPVSG